MKAVKFLFGKIELGFRQRAQLDELRPQSIDGGGELATQRTKRAARRLLARGVDEIGDCFGLR